MILLLIESPPVELGLMEWVGVVLATAIIFGINGKRVAADLRKWRGRS